MLAHTAPLGLFYYGIGIYKRNMSQYIKTEIATSLVNAGFSVLVADKNKIPLYPWKSCQTKAWELPELLSKMQNPEAWRFGIVTGYDGLFVVDVDLKTIETTTERVAFWNEFISLVRESIDHFDDKVSVYPTKNYGYHLIYKVDTDLPCQKIAIQKGKKEALIETRSKYGYAVVYDKPDNGLDYSQCKELTKEEHDTIIGICCMYDERVEQETEVIEPIRPKIETKGLTPWQDYNQRHSVFDVIGDEFKVIRHLSTKTVIKRHGALSAHSGYVFKDTGCMYLFSTGTQYPHEKLLGAFACYAYKYHHGDMSEAAKRLYADGYGDRVKPSVQLVTDPIVKIEKKETFPLDVFPANVSNYITSCNTTLGHSIDYMGSGLIWMLSVIVGNSLKVEVKKGWVECGSVWIAVVGKAGVGKTPAINSVIKPLVEVNSREIREYRKMKEKYEAYAKLSKEDKANSVEVRKPNRGQFIVNDVTIEALVELHEENPNAVGVFKDELAGWIKDMNKYRAGGDLEFHLSAFSNSPAYTTRKTVRDNYIHSPIIPVLGGIQPAVLNQVFTDEYRDNGFSDRLLLCYPDMVVEQWNENEISDELLQWYNDYILSLHGHVRSELKTNDEGDVKSKIVKFSKEARKELARIMNKITDRQNSEDETEATKSILPKQKTYLPRFAILLHVLECYDNGVDFAENIEAETVLNAERLVDYYISMAEKVMQDGAEYTKLRASASDKIVKSDAEKFAVMYAANPSLNKSEAAGILKVSRQQIHRWIKQIEDAGA